MITWIATVIALIGTWLNCQKRKACFYFWMATNVIWAVWDVRNGVYARLILDLVQFILAVYGLHRWGIIDDER